MQTTNGRHTDGLVARMDDVTHCFGGRAVLTRACLRVEAGELVGVVGPNGGGKSTLLFLLAGLLRATAGAVNVCGVEAHALARTASGLVGLVTARAGLYPLLTARENLRHFGCLFGLAARDVDERAAPLARALEFEGALDAPTAQLSTGMQQKVSLIRALLLEPKLLLLDEPTANLDPLASSTLYAEVRRRADAGLSCVLVTHDLEAAQAICDRVLFVDGTVKRELTFAHRAPPRDSPLLSTWREVMGRG